MRPNTSCRVMALGLSCLLSACGKTSRFDDRPAVDVCAIVDRTDAEAILGPLTEPPDAAPPNGFAGVCNWQFESTLADRDGRLSVMVVTYASNAVAGNQSLGRWFETNMTALKASIDVHPKAVKGLGDRAFLFEFGKPGLSEILMRQGQTFVMARIDDGTSPQLEEFARVLARGFETGAGLSSKGDASGAAPAAKAAAKSAAPAAADAAHSGAAATAGPPPAAADAGGRGKDKTLMWYTIPYIEQCIRADRLLRDTCERWVGQMREDLRHNCELPAETFAARTADAYRAFREKFREQIEASDPELSTALANQQAQFEQRFANELAGNMSGLELESLRRILGRECVAMEDEWLPRLR